MVGRILIAFSIVSAAACRPAPLASSRPTLDASPNSPPAFRVQLADEIALTGPPVAAEALILRKDGIQIHTRTGQVGFSRTGQGGSTDGGVGGLPGVGADGFYDSKGLFVFAIVAGEAFVWSSWEIAGVGLDHIQYATGLGIGRDRTLCDGCMYISDGPGEAIKEFDEGGGFHRELALPGSDPEGVAVSPSGKV